MPSATVIRYAGQAARQRTPNVVVPFTPTRFAKSRQVPPPHLLTLADLSPEQISNLIATAAALKFVSKNAHTAAIPKRLDRRTVALIFNKRSTRTRVASETSVEALGGHPMFLGKDDIQLGVNETLEDTAKVVGSMTDGIMARVAGHEEIETLAKYSPVPVINALSDLYHPTQILADLLTLCEVYSPVPPPTEVISGQVYSSVLKYYQSALNPAKILQGKKVAWVGDTNNITNELLVTLPRFGMHFSVAAPKGYDKFDERVWSRLTESKTESLVTLTNSPAEALRDADVVVTDTWISMGQETEKAARLEAFKGYQITNEMVSDAGAKGDWKFMHCLPRKKEEVDDEVFYGPRSVVFPEAENRKWTIMAVFE
ncbi:ornithine carbamoyltransferase [Cryptococcus bacillisporus CA1873]|uniref:ornithine carbamoyltransferase n=1 Tax=Cryptococcus bacillisporus CA1873 TaxID=1296111 RepID=A0ABR5BFA2_CRYGA|nr:ornithine carbamoyltransferase [Cryptococcus bacillisporus CA1873]|eukprot:KIR67687.1 ornithine carbamoyltransferase [Cryptococcus gattii CA1873]